MIRKLCRAPGCDEVAAEGEAHCDEHLAEVKARAAAGKQQAKHSAVARAGAQFYRTKRWKQARLAFLNAHPLCADCGEVGLVVEATEVDHVVPHRGDPALMWDRSNWQALCKSCHSRKTAREVWGGSADRPGWSIPTGLRASAIPVVLVCGPPAAGKTRYVQERARPGDVVVDLDRSLEAVGGRAWERDAAKVKAAFQLRDEALRSLCGKASGTAWVIVMAPSRAERLAWCGALGARSSVVVLDVAAETCKARIEADPGRRHARDAMRAAVDRWWQSFDT